VFVDNCFALILNDWSIERAPSQWARSGQSQQNTNDRNPLLPAKDSPSKIIIFMDDRWIDHIQTINCLSLTMVFDANQWLISCEYAKNHVFQSLCIKNCSGYSKQIQS